MHYALSANLCTYVKRQSTLTEMDIVYDTTFAKVPRPTSSEAQNLAPKNMYVSFVCT